jgi:hypothetical protein
MAPDEGGDLSFGRRLRDLFRVYRLFVSIFIFVLGILLMTLAVGYFAPAPVSTSAPFVQINGVTGAANQTNYNLVFIIAGPIIFLVGAYFVGSYYLARRRFEHLMETKSKAEFLRNLPEVEDLLWDLTPRDELRYQEKKSDLRIRR